MAVQFSLHQVTSILPGPLYRVHNEVTAATGAEMEVFVFTTSTQTFSHYATVADVNLYPRTLAAAQAADKAFYRAASVRRDWPTVAGLIDDVNTTKKRVQLLAVELVAEVDLLTIDRTLTIRGA